ncbi:MAG: hypothetical protein RSF40_02090 [Oscillospiraceae bacterium]
MENLTSTLNVINNNKLKIIEAMKNAYKDSLNNHGLQYCIYLKPNGEVYIKEDVAGSNFVPASVYHGTDIIIIQYCNQYTDIDADEIEREIAAYNACEELDNIIWDLCR